MVSRTLAGLRIPLIFHCVNSLGLYPFSLRSKRLFAEGGYPPKGVILTETDQPLATPTPAELAKFFVKPPKVNVMLS